MSIWKNIQNGQEIDSPNVPPGGSDAGWVISGPSPTPVSTPPVSTPSVSDTPAAPAPTTWTNIITGEVITGAMPAGGSNAGWVPGTTAVGGASPTPYPGATNPVTGVVNPLLPSTPMPSGMIPDPSGAPMPLNPTPETTTPFQENAIEEAGIEPSELTEPDIAVDLTKPQETGAIQKSDEMAQAEMRINNVYESYKSGGLNPNQIRISGKTGDDFIKQAAMAGMGRLPKPEELSQLRGGTTGGVLAAFGLSGRILGSGESNNPMLETTGKINWNPALNDKQKLGIIALVQDKKRSDWNQTDCDNYNFATNSSEKVTTSVADATGANTKPASIISTTDPVTNQDIIDIQKFGDKLDADLKVIQDAETAAETQLADFQTSYELGMTDIEGQPIPMKFIAGQQNELTKIAAIKERNLIAKLGIVQQEKAGIIDRANLQMQIDDKIYARKRDIIKDAQAYRQDQQEALATIVNMFPNGIETVSPEMMTMINNAAKDTGIDAGLIIRALEMRRMDYDNEIARGSSSNVDFKQIGTDEDGNPTYGFVDIDNQKVTPINTSVSDSTAYFTDANGDNWNIAGWAADDNAKQSSMQMWSNRIGKLTDANLESKVKQFAPGLTTDMIRSTSANTGVSWEALLVMAVQEATINGQMSPVSIKNNNFGGLTFNNQDWIKAFGGVQGTARPSAEGGNYIKFPTPQAGLDAMGALMASYGKVSSAGGKINKEAKDWVKLINEKKAKLSDVKGKNDKETSLLRKAVISEMANSGLISKADAELNAALQDKVAQIDNLIKSGSYKKVVGTFWPGRIPLISALTGEAQDATGDIKQLVATETLDTLIALKKSGGTLGALSDREALMLRESATKIGGWEILKNGVGTGRWNASESSFKKELENLKMLTERAIKNAGGTIGVILSLEQELANNPSKIDDYNILVADNPDLNDDEIIQLLGL